MAGIVKLVLDCFYIAIYNYIRLIPVLLQVMFGKLNNYNLAKKKSLEKKFKFFFK